MAAAAWPVEPPQQANLRDRVVMAPAGEVVWGTVQESGTAFDAPPTGGQVPPSGRQRVVLVPPLAETMYEQRETSPDGTRYGPESLGAMVRGSVPPPPSHAGAHHGVFWLAAGGLLVAAGIAAGLLVVWAPWSAHPAAAASPVPVVATQGELAAQSEVVEQVEAAAEPTEEQPAVAAQAAIEVVPVASASAPAVDPSTPTAATTDVEAAPDSRPGPPRAHSAAVRRSAPAESARPRRSHPPTEDKYAPTYLR